MMTLTRDGTLGWLYRMSLPARFFLAFIAGCGIFWVVRWAVFGNPSSDWISGMLIVAFFFALIVGVIPATYEKKSQH